MTMTRILTALICLVVILPQSRAETSSELRHSAEKALSKLCRSNSGARTLRDQAVAILVFPNVYKAGFMVGAQTGNGVLFQQGHASGYYNTTAASYGFQAGIQKFSYALFFMDEHSLQYLKKTGGFELGGAPSLVVADQGFSTSMSTTTFQKGIYAFFFGQKGLMGGIGLQGTKITEYTPSE